MEKELKSVLSVLKRWGKAAGCSTAVVCVHGVHAIRVQLPAARKFSLEFD